MLNFLKVVIAVLFTGLVLTLSGCAVHHVHNDGHDYGYGPPPHAPAHGYRAKYNQHDLVYDARLGVYVVVGFHDHYYHDGNYYRHNRDGWHYSPHFDRDWRPYNYRDLPPGLAKKYSYNDRSKYRSEGNGRKYGRY